MCNIIAYNLIIIIYIAKWCSAPLEKKIDEINF